MHSANLKLRNQRRQELRGVILLAIPFVITTSSRALMDVADFTMITMIGQPEAKAAILPAQMIMFVCIVFGMGVVSMVATFASQALGRGTLAESTAYAWQALYLSIAFGLGAVVLQPFVPNLIALMGHAPLVQQLEIQYAEVAILSVGPSVAAQALAFFFNGIHRPWITMWTALEANVVNIVVSAALIFGWFGIAPMGIAGAAWGTLVAVVYRAVRMLLTMLAPKFAREYSSRGTWQPSKKRMMNLLRVGVPSGFHFVNEVLVWTIFTTILIGRTFGTADQIATNTAWQYLRVAFMPTMGVGFALTSIVGKCIGARDLEAAMRYTRIAFSIVFVYLLAMAVVYWTYGGELIGLFNRGDTEVIRIGAKIMMCAAVFQLFDAMGITYSSALRGAGDTFWPSVFFVVGHWAVVIGGGMLMIRFYPELGSVGPWIAASALICVCALFVWWRWRTRAWMKLDIFRDRSGTTDVASAEEDARVGELLGA